MPNQFVPHEKEKIVKAEITVRESHLLLLLRKCAFGKITVHKASGLIVRVESNESIPITGDEGLDIAY